VRRFLSKPQPFVMQPSSFISRTWATFVTVRHLIQRQKAMLITTVKTTFCKRSCYMVRHTLKPWHIRWPHLGCHSVCLFATWVSRCPVFGPSFEIETWHTSHYYQKNCQLGYCRNQGGCARMPAVCFGGRGHTWWVYHRYVMFTSSRFSMRSDGILLLQVCFCFCKVS
jgi:hypothetical protein